MHLAAAILAGGRASRLGGLTKGLLRDAAGVTILDRLLRALHAAGFTDILLSANDPSPCLSLGRPIVPDARPGAGPLGGLEAVLAARAASCHAVLVLPCDLPEITATEIRVLRRAAAAAPGQLLFAAAPGGEHPLCAVVPTAVLPALRRALDRGEYGVRRLWADLGARPVTFDSAAPFENINTPEDLARWRQPPAAAEVAHD